MNAFHFVNEILNPYVGETKSSKKSTGQETQEYCRRRLEEFFDGWYLANDTRAAHRVVIGSVVRDYREQRRKKVGPHTIKRELAVASRATNHAITEWDLDLTNPFQGRMVAAEDRGKLEPAEWREVTDEQHEKILAACDPLLRDMYLFARATGLRQSEILALTWSQVSGNAIRFTADEQKSGLKDVCALSERAAEVLSSQAHHSIYVVTKKGKQISKDHFVKYMWRSMIKRSGLSENVLWKVATRKMCGQKVYKVTGSLELAQGQLRHRSIETTRRFYTKKPLDPLAEGLAKAGL